MMPMLTLLRHTNEGRAMVADLHWRDLVFSLVSIGRYSSRFLSSMAERWEAGIIGYEEILLPVTCRWLNYTSRWACRTAAFSTSTYQRPSNCTLCGNPRAFRFRPDRNSYAG